MSNDLECPVDNITVNESRVRLVAFFVLVLALICFITTNWIIVVFLLVDFTLRTFNLNSYSLLSLISGQLVKLFKLKNKPVDRAPKRFAAFIYWIDFYGGNYGDSTYRFERDSKNSFGCFNDICRARILGWVLRGLLCV
jgi:hypothetical protein